MTISPSITFHIIHSQASAKDTTGRPVFTDEKGEDFPHLGISPHPTMLDIVILSTSVEKLLLGLNPSKAAVPDAIPARFLKETAPELAPIFTQLFQ